MRPGDMVVRDAEGIIASVLFGPDWRTRVREDTVEALFGAWCPEGVPPDVVEAHLVAVAALLRQEWPEAEIAPPVLWPAAAGGG